MAKNFVSNTTASTRMFRNGFLELCSKVPFWMPIVLYLPVIGYFIWKAFTAGITIGGFILCFAGGLAVWTLAEYVLHRFVFHYVPKGRLGLRLHFIFHGVHHDYPSDALRLVLPPSVSVPLAFLFYFLFWEILPTKQMAWSFFPGFVLGYLIYDITHYAIHHFNFKSGWWKQIKQHHMLHHYQNPDLGYGVSSKIWDKIFRSDFEKKQQKV